MNPGTRFAQAREQQGNDEGAARYQRAASQSGAHNDPSAPAAAKSMSRAWERTLPACFFDRHMSMQDKCVPKSTVRHSVVSRSTTIPASLCLLLALALCFLFFWNVVLAQKGSPGVRFVDVTRALGIQFVHNSGAAGKKYLPETMGSGCAFFDFNGDGYQDILLINSTNWPGSGKAPAYMALYKNVGGKKFVNVTRSAGLAVELYGMGCAIGDYDNDGKEDIYVSALNGGRLFHNNGNETFTDVTERSGVKTSDFGTSCVWFDYDKDGWLDLYVANYVVWSRDKDIFCTLDGVNKSYCTPESYQGVSGRLYHNDHNGKFTDVTRKAGLNDAASKGLGVCVVDFNRDGWPDLLVANDTQPNKLYQNNGNGTFAEKGTAAGVAFNEDGVARGAMGVDAGDYDGSGNFSLVIGNFSNEMIALYHNEGNGLFIDEAPSSTVGQASLLTLAFGTFFFDFDLDGWMDIFVANGHVENDINKVQRRVTYAQPPHLFWNRSRRQFAEVTTQMGPEFTRSKVARGAAYGDFDRDGDLDVLMTTNNGPAYLFENRRTNGNHWVSIQTKGTRSNRDGIGTLVKVSAGGKTQQQTVHSGSSYCSQSQLPLVFGLGSAAKVDRVEVLWPSGKRQELKNVAVDKFYLLDEDKGLTGR
ncbi:MAG TPA: CRTAC1 family protein [Acidobacteriota bacterium]